MKKRTLLDRVRDAIRAFRGKSIGSVTFGVDVKKCSECDRNSGVLYICDQTLCKKCSPECKHTTDIRHAKNFVSCPGPQNSIYYEEIDTITEEDAMKFFEEDGTDD